jgi:type I restriction enzyme, S subunit
MTESWIKTAIRDIAVIKIGLTYKPENVSEDGFFVIRSSNIQDAKFIRRSDDVYVKSDIPENLDVLKDDIIMCARNGSKALIGKSAIIPISMPSTTFGAFMLRIRGKHNQYLYQYFQSYDFFKYINRDMGATINQVTTNYLGELTISIPPLPEQKKIAEILSTWDEAIELLNKKLKFHETYRQSMMKKIINGKYTIQKKSNNNFRLKSFLKQKNEQVGNRNIEPVAVGINGIRLRSAIYDKELSSDYSKNKVIRVNNLCFGIGTNNIVYDVLLEDKEYCVSPAYKVFEVNDIEPFYLKCYLDTFNDYFSKKYMIISARQGKSVDMDGLLNEKIFAPNMDKQIQFSRSLKSFDEYIKLLNDEINNIKSQKQGLMQRLLTGKIRVNLD